MNGWVGSTNMRTRLEVHSDSSKYQIVSLPVEPALNPHATKQAMGSSVIPIVSVLHSLTVHWLLGGAIS